MHITEYERRQQLAERLRHTPAFQRLGAAGRAYVEHSITQGPSREVGRGALFANAGEMPTASGLQTEYESEGGERAFLLATELEGRALVFAQPLALQVRAHDTIGRSKARPYTPDYLIATDDAFQLIEVKPLSQLRTLQRKYPRDWVLTDGVWQYLPALHAARQMGLTHEVFCPDRYSPQYRANLEILIRLKHEPPPQPGCRLVRALKATLRDKPQSIRELLQAFTTLTGDQLISLVQGEEIFALLHDQTIGQDLILYATREQIDEVRARIARMNGSLDVANEYTERLLKASPRELARAEEAIRAYNARRTRGVPMNATDYRRRAAIMAATQSGAPAVAGLVPRYSCRGGGGPAYDATFREEVLSLVRTYLGEEKRIPSPSKAHALVADRLERDGKTAPSVETVRRWIAHEFTPERLAAFVGGPRAIQRARRKTEGTVCIARAADAVTIAHCDAVYGDIKARDGGAWTDFRPVVFPLVLAGSNYILSVGIVFGRPSFMGLAMALRLCIEAHGWLPQRLIHDRGAEFRNGWTEELAAHFGLETTLRPIAAARSGSEVERVNGQLNAFLQSLPGGTYHDQRGRDADGARKGSAHAALSSRQIVQRILEHVHILNSTRRGSNEQSPQEAFAAQIAGFPGARLAVQTSDAVRYLTSYPIRARSFDYRRGLAYAGRRYSADAAAAIVARNGTLFDFRLDSLDPSTIWAKSQGGIVRLTSNENATVAGMDLVDRICHHGKLALHSRVEKFNQADNRRTLLRLRETVDTCSDPVSSSERPQANVIRQTFEEELVGKQLALADATPTPVDFDGE